jgi:hypothetical protein
MPRQSRRSWPTESLSLLDGFARCSSEGFHHPVLYRSKKRSGLMSGGAAWGIAPHSRQRLSYWIFSYCTRHHPTAPHTSGTAVPDPVPKSVPLAPKRVLVHQGTDVPSEPARRWPWKTGKMEDGKEITSASTFSAPQRGGRGVVYPGLSSCWYECTPFIVLG